MPGISQSAEGFRQLDGQELDYWIICGSAETRKDASIPFHTSLQHASEILVSVANVAFPSLTSSPTIVQHDLVYKALRPSSWTVSNSWQQANDTDDGGFGARIIPANISCIGNKSIGIEKYSEHLLQFAFVLWERKTVAATVEQCMNFSILQSPTLVTVRRNP